MSGSHLGNTVDLLDLLRIATLQSVEAISAWRKKKRSQEPYKWNGLNYLLKLPSDLDFLQKHSGLVQWLGFTLERNPFVLPVNLDCHAHLTVSSADGRRDSSTFDRAESDRQVNASESGRFIEVGGKRRLDVPTSSSQRPESPSRATAVAALAERKRAKNPYETRVVNDEELLPLNGKSVLASNDTNAGAAAGRARPKSRAATAAFVVPSQIGELDMTRIRDAETLVLQEEARFGRFTRDARGLIVPEDEARRRRNMVEMSGDVYSSASVSDRQQRREDDSQEERQDAGDVSTADSDDPNNALLRSHARALPGKVYAKKKAGMLGPISKPRASCSVSLAAVHAKCALWC